MKVATDSVEKGLIIEKLINQDLKSKCKSVIEVEYDCIYGIYNVGINGIYVDSIDNYIFQDEEENDTIDEYIYRKRR